MSLDKILQLAVGENWHTLPTDSPEYQVYALSKAEEKPAEEPKKTAPKKAAPKKTAKKTTTKKKGK